MKTFTAAPPGADRRAGFAILVVLLALLALLVLCAPFLWTSSEAARTSSLLADQTRADLALDDAARHARFQLSRSHDALDESPWFDSLEELQPEVGFEDDFYAATDDRGTAWDHRATDLSGRVDLGSASPQLIANLLGAATYLTAGLAPGDDALPLAADGGFRQGDVLWIDGELVPVGVDGEGGVTASERGLLFDPAPGGPTDAAAHAPGSVAFSQVAWAIPMWRAGRGFETYRALALTELLDEAQQYAVGGGAGFDGLRRAALERTSSLYADVAGSRRWQHPARLLSNATAGETDLLRVDSARWFNPGTTVRIDGPDGVSELALVRAVDPGGTITLLDAVLDSYTAGAATVSPLSRRPVNVNTAEPVVLQALFENLQLRGRNERVTTSEARELAARIVAERPFDGFQDFMERVVLPAAAVVGPDGEVTEAQAAQGGFMDLEDALAIQRNALNANDAALSFSTAPLCFTSRDAYLLELRAALNAPSGVERALEDRAQVEWVAPQEPLIKVWGTQHAFDEELRLDREAPGYATGPEPTSVPDANSGADPPSRAPANFTLVAPTDDGGAPGVHSVYADREGEDAWARPAVSRVDEEGQRGGRVFHFDYSTDDPEGHDLGRERLDYQPGDARLDWVLDNGFMGPMQAAFWLKPRSVADARLVDVGGASQESDRVSLLFEGSDLVLRVLDAPGDHPDTTFEEVAEVRYELAGDGAGIPADVWTHFEVDVRGNRPDQLLLRVDGFPRGRTLGLTELTGGLGPDDAEISVESTEGFPDRCVLRIGDELIEAVVTGPSSFSAAHHLTGELAGFGGRLAREQHRWDQGDEDVSVPVQGLQKDIAHPSGTPVQLYGYSLPVDSNLPPGGSELDGELGPFAVGLVVGVEDAQQPLGDPVIGKFENAPVLEELQLGFGWDPANTEASGLVLAPPDAQAGQTDADVMGAFQPDGGYAAVVQRRVVWQVGGDVYDPPVTVEGSYLHQVAIVRYTGVDGNVLRIADWDVGSDVLANLRPTGTLEQLGEPTAFIVEWNLESPFGPVTSDPSSDELNATLVHKPFVVPISLRVPGVGGGFDFVPAAVGDSQFAQITEVDDAELTEWVRYDEIVTDHLVRDDPSVLGDVYLLLAIGDRDVEAEGGDDDEEEGDDGTSFSIVAVEPAAHAAVALAPPAPTPATAAPLAGAQWQPEIGEEEDGAWPLSRAVRTHLQFRGVLDTHSHAHAVGTPVVPVFSLPDPPGRVSNPQRGWPGRFDSVFLMDGTAEDPGFPAQVHRGVRPRDHRRWSWIEQEGSLGTLPGSMAVVAETEFQLDRFYVALREQAGVPLAAGAVTTASTDFREYARLSKFPSGELPREVDAVAIGGAFDAQSEVPDALVDEVLFGDTEFGLGTPLGEGGKGAQMVVSDDLGPEETTLRIRANQLRVAGRDAGLTQAVLDPLPDDGGLLRVGREVLAYSSYDAASGVVTIAEGGRGLLGTDARPHRSGEGVTWLSHTPVSILQGGLDEGDAELFLADLDEFPAAGTVLVGEELVHHTAKREGSLVMPRRSNAPGAADAGGNGLFRGRFGSAEQSHPSGTPVVWWPYRYWDRWEPESDAAELHYFGFHLSQPDAFVRRAFFQVEPTALGGARTGVLQRVSPDVPWDGAPDETDGLRLHRRGDPASGGAPVDAQSSLVEWRFFTEYQAGAFLPDGSSHAWKEAPSLRLFGVEFVAPGRVFVRGRP